MSYGGRDWPPAPNQAPQRIFFQQIHPIAYLLEATSARRFPAIDTIRLTLDH